MINSLLLEIGIGAFLVLGNFYVQHFIDTRGAQMDDQKSIIFTMKWNAIRLCCLLSIFIIIVISKKVSVVPFTIIFITFYLLTLAGTIYRYGTDIR